MTRRIKWDRKIVERARDLADANGGGAAAVRDDLRREGIDVPYDTVVDWLRYKTRLRPLNNETGNLSA